MVGWHWYDVVVGCSDCMMRIEVGIGFDLLQNDTDDEFSTH
jgi:hypothetical protein